MWNEEIKAVSLWTNISNTLEKVRWKVKVQHYAPVPVERGCDSCSVLVVELADLKLPLFPHTNSLLLLLWNADPHELEHNPSSQKLQNLQMTWQNGSLILSTFCIIIKSFLSCVITKSSLTLTTKLETLRFLIKRLLLTFCSHNSCIFYICYAHFLTWHLILTVY